MIKVILDHNAVDNAGDEDQLREILFRNKTNDPSIQSDIQVPRKTIA